MTLYTNKHFICDSDISEEIVGQKIFTKNDFHAILIHFH